jgi:hypothetical protein
MQIIYVQGAWQLDAGRPKNQGGSTVGGASEGIPGRSDAHQNRNTAPATTSIWFM